MSEASSNPDSNRQKLNQELEVRVQECLTFQTELSQSEAKNLALLSALPDLMLLLDRHGIYLDCIPAKGFQPIVPIEQIIGAKVSDVLPPDVAVAAMQAIQDSLQRQDIVMIEYSLLESDGWRDFEARIAPYGKDTVLAIVRDISDRKKNENAISLQAQIINQIHDAVVSTDRSDQITSWNKGAVKLLGYKPEEALGQQISIIYNVDRSDSLANIKQSSWQTTGSYSGEVILRHKSGREFYANLSLSMLKNSQGENIGTISCLMDISDRKIAENALLESEKRFRHIFENAPIGMNLVDIEGRYIQANQSMCDLVKYSEAELKEFTIEELTHPDDFATERIYLEQIANEEISNFIIEKRYLTKLGDEIWVNLTAATVRDTDGNMRYGFGMVEDISDRKKSEEALRLSEERFRKIFEEGPLGMAVIGFNQRVLKVNAMLCQMLGYTEAEMMSQPFSFITHPLDLEIDSQLSKQLYYGRISNYQIEKRYITKDRATIWVAVTASVVRNDSGKILYSLAMIRDITRRRESQQQLEASLQEKEILLKEIHHRVKNNLHVITNLLDLQSQYVEDEQVLDLFADSQNRIYSMALIHEQLYQSHTLGHIEFSEYVKSLADNLFISYSISNIQQNLDIESVMLNFETAMPCGLILNELISNSLKYAFPDGRAGEIKIQFCAIRTDNDRKSKDNLYRMIVSDDGVGIPDHVDWLSTNSLGLRLVRILTRQLEGTIEIDRSNGTQFCFTFAELSYKERLNPNEHSQDSNC